MRVFALFLLSFGVQLSAQVTEFPAYLPIRHEEDWSLLRDRSLERDELDRFKFLRLTREGWYLTLAGEARERFELVDHPSFGAGPTDTNGYFLQRYLFSADVHMGDRVRFFGDVQSGLGSFRTGGPRPTDVDRLDLHQGFLDFNLGKRKPTSLLLRLGRQEISFGVGRLIAPSEGLNVRRALDGVRLIYTTSSGWTWNTMAMRLVQNGAGVFDDPPDAHQTVWGVGVYGPNRWLKGTNLSLYYIGTDKPQATHLRGAGQALRHTFGSRLWFNSRRWDGNYEAFYQAGAFQNSAVRAWALASDSGFTFRGLPWSPRLGLRSGLTSGDRTGTTLRSFDPLFPSPSAYTDPSGLLAPINLADIALSVRISPRKTISLTLGAAGFFRQNLEDGIYSFGGPLRRTGTSNARHVASSASASFTWQIQRHWTYLGIYEHFVLGEYLRQTQPTRVVTVGMSSLAFRF